MADVWPKHSLAESDPWARRVSEATRSNERDIASLATQVTAQNQGTAASLDALRQQIIGLQEANERLNEANERLNETVEYLRLLSPVSAQSNVGGVSVPQNTWTANSDLRPSVSISTPTGRLRITLSAFLGGCLATFSIPGYVTRDETIGNSGRHLAAYGTSANIVASRQIVLDGLPINAPVTVTAEIYGTATGGGLAGYVGITAEPIP